LPSADDKRMSNLIEGAFSSRPDVLSALAQVRAAQSDIDAVAASYLPKVVAGGNVVVGSGNIGLSAISSGGISSTSSSGVFVGVTIPIYDGRLRDSRTKNSQDRLDAATSGVGVVTSLAAREIGLAYEGLRTALAVHSATSELVRAAKVTTNAAKEAYIGGLGTLSDASAASLGLFVAEEALADARKAAHHAAIILALATGS
jgi:outer membrane protein